jgi:hypothetical protein
MPTNRNKPPMKSTYNSKTSNIKGVTHRIFFFGVGWLGEVDGESFIII